MTTVRWEHRYFSRQVDDHDDDALEHSLVSIKIGHVEDRVNVWNTMPYFNLASPFCVPCILVALGKNKN